MRAADPQWGPVAAHVLENLGNGSNGTVVVENTFAKMREHYPGAPWLGTTEDLGKLVLWASGQERPDDKSPMSLSEARRIAMAQANSLLTADPQGELLSWLRQGTGKVGSQAFLLGVSGTLKLLQLTRGLISTGLTTLVFFTFTFYMLAGQVDPMTIVVRSLLPHASNASLDKLQDTIEAIITIPVSAAARNAMWTLLLFPLRGVPSCYLAALRVMVFTLFPLTYPWVVVLPWVLAHVAAGRLLLGLGLWLGMVLACEYKTAEQKRQEDTLGLGEYVGLLGRARRVHVRRAGCALRPGARVRREPGTNLAASSSASTAASTRRTPTAAPAAASATPKPTPTPPSVVSAAAAAAVASVAVR